MLARMRPFKDRDFIKTVDGFFSCVVGYIHPPDKIISYVKYIPDEKGRWGRDGEKYRRFLPYYTIPFLMENIGFLRKKYPKYVFYSDVMNTTMSCCPVDIISEHYVPEVKFQRLLECENRDPLQDKLVDLVELISNGNRDHKNFGVTGSILTDIYNPNFSDIDLTIYGLRSSLEVKKKLLNLYDQERTCVRRLEGEKLEERCKSKAIACSLTRDEAKIIYKRKWNRGVFDGTIFSIHPTRLKEEITESYGDRIFHPKGIVKIRAIISNTRESIFLPCTYGIEEADVLEGPQIDDVTEVTTYDGLFGDIFDPGEKIEASGKLEMVSDKRSNKEYYRVLIGSLYAKGLDYIKPLCPRERT